MKIDRKISADENKASLLNVIVTKVQKRVMKSLMDYFKRRLVLIRIKSMMF